MKCSLCRKREEEVITLWEKVRRFFFHFFHNDILDLTSEKYTQGFGDGYQVGFNESKKLSDVEIAKVMSAQSIYPEDWVLQEKDVLTKEGGLLYLGGEEITPEILKQLKAEATAIKNFKLYKVICETLRQKAIEKAVLKSTDFDQTLSGKLMIHSLGIINSVVDEIDKK